MNDNLARRAVACAGWRWLPGMRDMGGNVYLGRRANAPDGVHQWAGFDRSAWEWHETEFGLPDFTDPGTLGCLLALAREDGPWLWIRWWPGWPDMSGVDRSFCEVVDRMGRRVVPGPRVRHATEAEALVAALEAAPA